jgi:DNA modification methylase
VNALTVSIIEGDAVGVLKTLPAEHVQVCVTSPPYYALRDYGVAGQIGLEATPGAFLDALLTVFDEVRRVLRKDGLCFVNLGDSYAPDKHLRLIPERFAIGMQDRGWICRSRIAWCKTSAMPESVRDRPTSAWEHVWMFSKSRTYYYDADAVRQPYNESSLSRYATPMQHINSVNGQRQPGGEWAPKKGKQEPNPGGANLRNYWLLGPEPSSLEHYAGFPTELPKRCILAGTSERGCCPACGAPWVRLTTREYVKSPVHGDGSQMRKRSEDTTVNGWAGMPRVALKTGTLGWQPSCQCPPAEPVPQTVLDPFLGSGTTALVADRLGRYAIGIELSPEYAEMARRRIESDAPLFSEPVEVVPTAVQASLWGHSP